ncbi:MAG TPA: cytochrome c biogenesis protein CcsA [Gemmatimonadaceae bacterium]|jgi:heme exporter protein C|nr:cytochrome c biogenesis protein CcsA [Gemmatimonadaceae bacterium]
MYARFPGNSRALGPPPSPLWPFDWSIGLAAFAVIGVAIRAIWFTPIEARQGPAQKIFYVHPPSAFVGMYVGFGLMALASGVYLWLHDDRADLLAESSGEVGLAFLTVALVTGPIWGKTVWGAWWTWDARLTSTLFLWFLVAGYLVLRGAIEDPELRARYSAVLALLSVPLILFIHLSVYFFRTLHPMPIVFKPSEPSLTPEMLTTFALAFLAMLILYIALVRARYRLALVRAHVEDGS